MAFSKTQEREQTEFSNRPQAFQLKLQTLGCSSRTPTALIRSGLCTACGHAHPALRDGLAHGIEHKAHRC